MRSSSLTADAIVVGGGIHGCSAALHLALRGLDVIVIEKDYIARHASGLNAGGVRRLGRAFPEIPLADAALKRWCSIRELVDDDCGFESSSQIKVAETETELSTLRDRCAAVRSIGFNHEEIIDQKQLRSLLPAIAPHCIGGIFVNGDGHANPFKTAMAFKRKAISLGVRIYEHLPVTYVDRFGTNWRATTFNQDFEAPIIINCAGAWGGAIATQVGDNAPLEAQALMLMITARMPNFVKPVVGSQGRALSFKQFKNGTVLIGGGYQGRAEPEHNRTHLNFQGLGANAQAAAALFPIMQHSNIVRCWAGIEGVMPDAIPVIGAGREQGVYHAFGFSGHGFALAPIVGRIIADLISSGRTDLSIKDFNVQRFENYLFSPGI